MHSNTLTTATNITVKAKESATHENTCTATQINGNMHQTCLEHRLSNYYNKLKLETTLT